MCFTISYGLVRFPEAGILDAAQGSVSSGAQKEIVLKPTEDGSAFSEDAPSVSSALSASNASSDELFITESTTPPTKGISDSQPDNDSSADNNALDSNLNSNESSDSVPTNSANNSSDKALTVDVTADKAENNSEKSESNDAQLSAMEDSSEDKANEQADSLDLISVPDNDYIAQDNSMPIEADTDPLQDIGPLESDIAPILVPSVPPASEETMEPKQNTKPISESGLEPMPNSEQSKDDIWEQYLKENSPTQRLSSDIDNSQTDSTSSSTTEKNSQKNSEPTTIKTDPIAQEIPARNREMKPANKDALTRPAVNEPQNDSSNGTIQKSGTIPIETFPLDLNEPTQKTNYTIEYNEPYDKYGFDIPATGQIFVKRFPSVENSVDPIYNNAQLDRFAL